MLFLPSGQAPLCKCCSNVGTYAHAGIAGRWRCGSGPATNIHAHGNPEANDWVGVEESGSPAMVCGAAASASCSKCKEGKVLRVFRLVLLRHPVLQAVLCSRTAGMHAGCVRGG
jgi:hypothetical protein